MSQFSQSCVAIESSQPVPEERDTPCTISNLRKSVCVCVYASVLGWIWRFPGQEWDRRHTLHNIQLRVRFRDEEAGEYPKTPTTEQKGAQIVRANYNTVCTFNRSVHCLHSNAVSFVFAMPTR